VALYHVKNNTIGDMTGTVTVFNSQGSTTTANATDLVRPGDWNSAHSQVITLAGNTAGASTASGTNIVFQGGNNVTASVNQGANAATIVFSGANTVAQTVQTQASGNIVGAGFTSTTTAGTAVVATHNSQGLSMGVPAYITTYANDLTSGRAGTGFTSTTTAGTAVVGTLNTNGLSIGVPTIITNALTTAAQVSHSHGNPTLALTNITGTTASASNGLTLSLSGVAAQTTQTQPAGNIAGVGTTFAGANVSGSMTLNSNGLNLSLSAPTPGGGGAINVSAGTTSGNLQTIQFNNANGVSFGLNGSTVTASVNAGGAGGTYNFYPITPVPLASSSINSGTSGATGGSTQATISAYCHPLVLNNALAYHEVEMVVSGQATAAGTGSASNGYMVGLYTNNASTLSLVTSYQWVHVASQNSVTARSHSWWWGTNSTSNSSSLGGNVSASFTRIANIVLNNSASTLNSGTYYVVVAHTHRTAGAAILANSSVMCQSWSQSTGGSYFGTNVLKPPFDERWFGVLSTTLNAANSGLLSLPNAIESTRITNTGGSSQWPMPFVRFYATNT
jgi:hypothetical protein